MERETGLEPATPSLGKCFNILKLFRIVVSVLVFSTDQSNQQRHMPVRLATDECRSNVLGCIRLDHS